MSWSLRRYAVLIASVTLVRLVLAAIVPVSGDEAEYWDMSRHSELSYLDHPPLLFWAMIPFRWLFGETSLAVRMPSIISSAALAFTLVPLARRLGGKLDAAVYAYLILLATPFFFLGSFYAWTDALLVTFYVGATLGAVMLSQQDDRGWWVFFLSLGFGFLSKLPIVLAVASLAPLALKLRSLPRRSALPAALAGAAVTAPVWIWSWQHDWVNFRFQLLDRHARAGFQPSALFDFIAGHLLLFTPFIAAGIGLAVWKAFRRDDLAWRCCAIAAVTPLVVFGISALRDRAGAHWGAPGLVVGCVLLALTPFPRRAALVRLGVATTALLIASAAAILLFADRLVTREWRYPFSPVSISTSTLTFVIGNEEIVQRAQARLSPGEMVASENYTNVHLWAFLSEGRMPTRLAWLKKKGRSGLPSLYWYTAGELRGRDFLFLTEKSGFDAELRRIFASVEEEEPIEIVRHGRTVRTVRALRCRNLLLPEGTFTLLKAGA